MFLGGCYGKWFQWKEETQVKQKKISLKKTQKEA